MNETPSPQQKIRDVALSSILFLQYALAADMESVEPLNQLLERCRSIRWDDPEFISLSEQMQPSPFENDKDSSLELRAFVAAIIQQNAELGEALTPARTALLNSNKTLESANQSVVKTMTYSQELVAYIRKMIGLHRQMRDQLESLAADTSPYVIPDLPKLPQF